MPEKKSFKLLILFITTIASFNNGFMGSAINIALPSIGKEFTSSAVTLSWISTSFLLASAVTLLPTGKLSDIFGRGKFFKAGIILFSISTIICSLSSSDTMMIISRVFQGVSSAILSTTSITMLVSLFAPNNRGKVIGINTTAVYLGLTLGPFIGGLILGFADWRYIYYSSALMGIICMILSFIFFKKDVIEINEKFDIKGSVIYTLTISILILGLTFIKSYIGIIVLFASLPGLYWFYKYEAKLLNPVFNVEVFKSNKQFTFSNLAALINYISTYAISFLLSLYLQDVRNFSSKQAGIILVVQPAFMAIFSPLAGRLSDKIEPRIVASIGTAILTMGLIFFIFLSPMTDIKLILINLAFIGFGFALFSSPNTNAVMGSVNKEYYGVAASTLGSMRMFGQMLSMSFVTIVFSFMIGSLQISNEVSVLLSSSIKLIFIVFSIFSIFSIFASLFRGKIHS